MRARALTFSFLTSLSVLRQEHRFPNTLFLCSRTFLCPRTTSSSYSPVSLSLALSPSQNLTISLRFRAPVTVVQTFTFLWEAGSPPRIGFARFALMFHRNELYKRSTHAKALCTFDVTNRIWRTIQLCIRTSDKPLRYLNASRNVVELAVSCATTRWKIDGSQTQRTEDRLRSERKVRIANLLPPPSPLAKRLLIAPADAKRIADIHKHRGPLFLPAFPRIYTATRLINESTSIVQTTSRTPPSLPPFFLSFSPSLSRGYLTIKNRFQ